MEKVKCIIYGCKNHHHEGNFVGPVCAPCFEIITTGKIGPTTSFIGELLKRNIQLQEQLAYLTKAKEALQALVDLKDYRIANGKNRYYKEKKNTVWVEARKALEYNKS